MHSKLSMVWRERSKSKKEITAKTCFKKDEGNVNNLQAVIYTFPYRHVTNFLACFNFGIFAQSKYFAHWCVLYLLPNR